MGRGSGVGRGEGGGGTWGDVRRWSRARSGTRSMEVIADDVEINPLRRSSADVLGRLCLPGASERVWDATDAPATGTAFFFFLSLNQSPKSPRRSP